MNFIRRNFLFILLGIFLLFCSIYWLYWHLTPFTADAFVFADTRAVTPWVEGYISDIYVKNNQHVKKGDPLFTTYLPPFELKVKILEHEIAAFLLAFERATYKLTVVVVQEVFDSRKILLQCLLEASLNGNVVLGVHITESVDGHRDGATLNSIGLCL